MTAKVLKLAFRLYKNLTGIINITPNVVCVCVCQCVSKNRNLSYAIFRKGVCYEFIEFLLFCGSLISCFSCKFELITQFVN
jgi:hypothetical protein